METAERADGTLAREIAAPGEKAADAREKTDIICALGNGESRGEEFRQGSQANELGGGPPGRLCEKINGGAGGVISGDIPKKPGY